MQIIQAFPWLLGQDDVRQRIVAEMVSQVGIEGVMEMRRMITAIRERDYSRAADEMLKGGQSKTLADLMRG